MRTDLLFTLLGFGFVSFLVAMVVLHKVMERRSQLAMRPERRRRLRAWAEARGGTYAEDVEINPTVTATERVEVTVEGVDLVLSYVEAGRLQTRVEARDRHGALRSGRILRHAGYQDQRIRERKAPFDRDFEGKGDALPDEVTKRLVLALKDDILPGHTVLQWAGKDLVGTLRGHVMPGPSLDTLCELVAHVVLCQPED